MPPPPPMEPSPRPPQPPPPPPSSDLSRRLAAPDGKARRRWASSKSTCWCYSHAGEGARSAHAIRLAREAREKPRVSPPAARGAAKVAAAASGAPAAASASSKLAGLQPWLHDSTWRSPRLLAGRATRTPGAPTRWRAARASARRPRARPRRLPPHRRARRGGPPRARREHRRAQCHGRQCQRRPRPLGRTVGRVGRRAASISLADAAACAAPRFTFALDARVPRPRRAARSRGRRTSRGRARRGPSRPPRTACRFFAVAGRARQSAASARYSTSLLDGFRSTSTSSARSPTSAAVAAGRLYRRVVPRPAPRDGTGVRQGAGAGGALRDDGGRAHVKVAHDMKRQVALLLRDVRIRALRDPIAAWSLPRTATAAVGARWRAVCPIDERACAGWWRARPRARGWRHGEEPRQAAGARSRTASAASRCRSRPCSRGWSCAASACKAPLERTAQRRASSPRSSPRRPAGAEFGWKLQGGGQLFDVLRPAPRRRTCASSARRRRRGARALPVADEHRRAPAAAAGTRPAMIIEHRQLVFMRGAALSRSRTRQADASPTSAPRGSGGAATGAARGEQRGVRHGGGGARNVGGEATAERRPAGAHAVPADARARGGCRPTKQPAGCRTRSPRGRAALRARLGARRAARGARRRLPTRHAAAALPRAARRVPGQAARGAEHAHGRRHVRVRRGRHVADSLADAGAARRDHGAARRACSSCACSCSPCRSSNAEAAEVRAAPSAPTRRTRRPAAAGGAASRTLIYPADQAWRVHLACPIKAPRGDEV